jgi:hypothetical protein
MIRVLFALLMILFTPVSAWSFAIRILRLRINCR